MCPCFVNGRDGRLVSLLIIFTAPAESSLSLLCPLRTECWSERIKPVRKRTRRGKGERGREGGKEGSKKWGRKKEKIKEKGDF